METSTTTSTSSSGVRQARFLRTLLHPVVLLVVAYVVFSLGIWKARVGFGDDTSPVFTALQSLETGESPGNAYVRFYMLVLRFVTPDPVSAALVVRTLVSLATTLALYYVLRAFRQHLHRGAVLMACAVWMVTHLNSPLVQYSNLSPFTFTIAMVGLGWLLRRRSWTGLLGFAAAIAWSASLRPEYFAPALLIGALVGMELVWKKLIARQAAGAGRGPLIGFSVALAAMLLIVGFALAPKLRGGGGMNQYLLFGLGQCYAAFYLGEHPDAGFHPMTEFQPLLDRTFGHPSGFFEAIGNNPREAFRYFTLNSLANLKLIPLALLSTRQTMVPSGLTGRLHAVLLLVVLLLGGAMLSWRLLSAWRGCAGGTLKATVRQFREEHGQLLWQVLLLVLFCSASSAAIVMLVGSPRYFISWVPMVYLAVAACFDSLVRLRWFEKREWLLVLPTLVLFCRPLFLQLGPNENHEVSALRTIAPKLRDNPVLAGVYTRPYQAYAFRGRAVSVNAGADLEAAGVREGRYDVLIVDSAMRASRLWKENREFFEAFEADPAPLGYVKLTEAFTGRRDIYYRPRAVAQP